MTAIRRMVAITANVIKAAFLWGRFKMLADQFMLRMSGTLRGDEVVFVSHAYTILLGESRIGSLSFLRGL